jgi:hypothetical protein
MNYANGVTMTIVDGETGTDRNVVGDTKKTPNGIQFIGSDGWVFVTRGSIKSSNPDLLDTPLPEDRAVKLYKSTDHMGNFFDCVRSRKDPVCDVEIGCRSVTVCHLGNIAYRLRRPLKWDPVKEEFPGDEEAKQDEGGRDEVDDAVVQGHVGDAHEMEDRPQYYSDDHLWAVLAVCAYLKETGDRSILDETVPYLDTGDFSIYFGLR